MFSRAEDRSLLRPLNLKAVPYRISLNADDVVVFLQPTTAELSVAKSILACFEGATGVATNLSKCSMTPIRCTEGSDTRSHSLLPLHDLEFPV